MENLASEVRKQFVLLYSNNNFLENFHKKFIRDIEYLIKIHKEDNSNWYVNNELKNKTDKIYLPTQPEMGKLELKQI